MSTPLTVIGTPNLFRRIATIIYDSFLLFACCLVTGGLVIAAKWATMDEQQIETMRAQGARILQGPIENGLLFAVSLLTVYIFFIYFWRKTGQTLAMQAWRTKIISSQDGGTPSLTQCTIRFLVAFLALLFGGLGYLWMYANKERKTWQDIASGTELQLLEKQKKA